MSDITPSKVKQISEHLRRCNENILTLSAMLDKALQQLEKATNDLADPEHCMSAQEVREKWITRQEVQELINSRALLEQCRRETDDIYRESTHIDKVISPIMEKYQKK